MILDNSSKPWVARVCFWALWAGVLLAVAGAKFRLINFYGSDVPFNDQWYGEALTTYAPFLDGRFSWQTLFAPHMEHRIVWTRLLDLCLLQANGRWDPRLQLLVDSLLLLGVVGVLIRHVLRTLEPLAATACAIFIALFLGSEVLWENTLWGFQSQFYLLLLFSLVHVLETSTARPWSSAWWLGHAAGLANLFTMAGGPMSAAAVLAGLAWRRWRAGQPATGDGFVALWNLFLLGLGAWALPASGITVHGGTRPPPLELLHRFLDVLSWPALDWRFGLLVWAPALVFLAARVLQPRRYFGPVWLLPLLLLILCFCSAVSYARGGALASRYSDFYSVGLIANFVCLLAWPAAGKAKDLKLIVLCIWCLLTVSWLWRDEVFAQVYTLQKDLQLREQEAVDIRTFFKDGDVEALRTRTHSLQGELHSLSAVRNHPKLRGILPLSLQEPIALTEAPEAAGGGFSREGVPGIPGLPPGYPAWGSFKATGPEAQWCSTLVSARLPFLVFYVAGELKPPATELLLQTEDGRTLAPLQQEVHATAKWVRLNFSNPGRPFKILARDKDPSRSFAFSAPQEFGRLSWLVPKVLHTWNLLSVAGWALLIAVALAQVGLWLREKD